MKKSKYNVYVEENGKSFIFNQLTGAFSELEKSLFDSIKNNTLSDMDNEEKEFLIQSNFICDKELKEELVLLQKNRIIRYGNHTARVTIMPTLDCNFRCWYCYESHIKEKMDEQTFSSVIKFVQKLISNNKLSMFGLDWFGGEPLMYFEEIMYPMAKEIMNLCNEANIGFSHSITTNGYLINSQMVEKFKEIKLNGFQITLDGSSEFHNKTRFSKTDKNKNSYDIIIKNITLLCNKIDDIGMTVRINYTPQTMHSIDEIAKSFPKQIRHKIQIMPQIVWQYKNEINEIDDTIYEKLKIFSKEGYPVEQVFIFNVKI